MTIDRADYNKQYYTKNKAKILSKLLEKVECEHCGRRVNHQNLKKHQSSPICIGKRKKLDSSDVEGLKKQIDELKELIKKSNE